MHVWLDTSVRQRYQMSNVYIVISIHFREISAKIVESDVNINTLTIVIKIVSPDYFVIQSGVLEYVTI